jgi:hypothetical protein
VENNADGFIFIYSLLPIVWQRCVVAFIGSGH